MKLREEGEEEEETEAEEEETEREDCTLCCWREEGKASERDEGLGSEDETEEEETLRYGGGGGRESVGGGGVCSTVWVRLCWEWERGREEDTEARKEEPDWGAGCWCCWEEDRLSRELRPPEAGSAAPN